MASRTSSDLEHTSQTISRYTLKADILCIPTDISRESEVKTLFQKTKRHFGTLHFLINNAGILKIKPFLSMDSKTWDEVLGVNLKGTFLCSKEAFVMMKESGGAIVNVSSLSGIKGTEKFPGLSAYTASKFGVVGLTEALAVEGKPINIRVNGIAPGAVQTRMLKQAGPFLRSSTTPEDIAKLILFLCDDTQSDKLTGSVLEIFSNE